MSGGEYFCVFTIEFGFLLSLFLFHPSVLKPDFDLSFVESQSRGDFDPSSPSQIFVEMKFLFQFGQLFVGEVGTPQIVVVGGRRVIVVIVIVGRTDVVIVVVDVVVV